MTDNRCKAHAQRSSAGSKLRPGRLDCWLPDTAESVTRTKVKIAGFRAELKDTGSIKLFTALFRAPARSWRYFFIYMVFQKAF